MARPTKYKAEYAEQAGKLCKKGFTDKDLADFFGVDESTITRWKQSHDEFCTSIKGAKKYSDDKIVESLYNRALGYTITEEREEYSETNGKKTVKVTKQVAGDTTAQIFWLKNRQPQDWRDKQEINQNTELTVKQISDEKLKEELGKLGFGRESNQLSSKQVDE